jgi:hypothetical protein|tara:strand:+ start:543 stop:1190 length:648 start_codon:yes stop_codon:yes gene_type:complete
MTTSLDDLPQPNINLNVTEQNRKVGNPIQEIETIRNTELQQGMSTQTPGPAPTQPPAPAQGPPHVEGNNIDINSFVTGLQQAAASGALQLPSRDIPQTQGHLTQDNHLQPNYIPEQKGDYIQDTYNQEQIINNQSQNLASENRLDAIYDDIHIPIILSVIYFVFQLPIIKTNTLKYIPTLFNKDGNFNILGYLINSLAFSSTYYCIIKSLDYLSV